MVVVLVLLLTILLIALVGVGYLFVKTFAQGSPTRRASGTAGRGGTTLEELNRERGAAGEAVVTDLLRQLPPSDYDVFTTVVLAPEHGGDHGVEMDHVVLSRFGIIVIETKRWGGHVQGGEEGDWVQSIGRQVHPKRNPYAQNDRQVRRLRNHLGVSASAIRGVVCFVGDTTLGPDIPANVVSSAALITYVMGFHTPVFDDDGLARYRDGLQKLAGPRR